MVKRCHIVTDPKDLALRQDLPKSTFELNPQARKEERVSEWKKNFGLCIVAMAFSPLETHIILYDRTGTKERVVQDYFYLLRSKLLEQSKVTAVYLNLLTQQQKSPKGSFAHKHEKIPPTLHVHAARKREKKKVRKCRKRGKRKQRKTEKREGESISPPLLFLSLAPAALCVFCFVGAPLYLSL